MNKRILSVGLALAASLTAARGLTPVALSGQVASRPTPTFLALPESFPNVDARVVLLREPGRDVILLRHGDAGPETLGAALSVLRRLQGEPLPPGESLMVPITGFALRRPMTPAQRERLERMLSRLRQEPHGTLGNLGPGRSLQLADGDV